MDDPNVSPDGVDDASPQNAGEEWAEFDQKVKGDETPDWADDYKATPSGIMEWLFGKKE